MGEAKSLNQAFHMHLGRFFSPIRVWALGSVLVSSAFAASLPAKFSGVDLATGQRAEIALAAPDKKGTIFVFISGKCPCSKAHEKHLKALAAEFAADFRIVGVNANQNEDEAGGREHFGPLALGFPVVRDEKAKLADALGALKTPHAFVVAPDGRTVLYRGGVSDSHKAESAGRLYLRETLLALREGKPVPEAETRVLGCYINRGK